MSGELGPGQRIRELRESRRMSGRKVAETLHISPQYYYDLERGRRRLNEDLLPRLAEIYGVTVDYILGRSSNPRGHLLEGPAADGIVDQIVAALPADVLEWLSRPGVEPWIEITREAAERGLTPQDIAKAVQLLCEAKERWERGGTSKRK